MGTSSDTSNGTATWKCKQLVLRINSTNKSSSQKGTIEDRIGEYIKSVETQYGTTFNNRTPTANECKDLIGRTDLSNDVEDIPGWKFGTSIKRSYNSVEDVKFEAGLNYTIGGIQPLLSPDIFSVSEMKMYDYANRTNNKVFIGEWNSDYDELEYYGSGTIKTSPDIEISSSNFSVIKWRHNFNIPPKYLEAKVYAKFTMDYDNFYNGDVVENLVNVNGEPLTVKLTGTEVQINLSNGIGFTNPETGEFMSFKNGDGVQMDRQGEYDAYNAAINVGAEDYVLDYGSTIASTITGGYPFVLYFVVKRLF